MSSHPAHSAPAAGVSGSSVQVGRIFRPPLITAAIHLVLVGGLLVAWQPVVQAQTTAPAASQTQQVNTARTYGIPAGPLDAVLARFISESGVPLAATPQLVQGRQSRGVSGSYSSHQAALDALLAGTGLRAVRDSGGQYRLRAAAEGEAVRLGTVTVTDTAIGGSGTTEGTGSYTATGPQSSATPLALTLRETPQSVSVLTRERIDNQAMTTLDDALRNVTGIVVRKGDHAGDTGDFRARGFQISNLMLDGLPTSTGTLTDINTDNDSLDIYDRIEVVRGATGLMSGAGTPSASINLVRKHPTADPQASITLSAGSWDNYRAMVDAGTPLNDAGTLRGRVVVSAQDAQRFYDTAYDRNRQFYGIIEADLTSATLVAVGFHHRRVDNDGNPPSLPVRADNSFYPGLSRSTNLVNAFDYWEQTDNTAFAEITQQLGGDWSAKLAALWKRPELDNLYTGHSRSGDFLYQNSQRYVVDSEQDSYDLTVKGSFTLFQRRHELAFGASTRTHEHETKGGWDANAWTANGLVVDPYNWDPNTVSRPFIDMTLYVQDIHIRQSSFYAVSRWHLAERLKLIVGARSHDYKFDNHLSGVSYKVRNEITPYVGLVYDIDSRHTVYASWTEIFEPQSNVDRNGNYLEPITGVNYEAGIKGEYFNKRLNVSLAAFQIKQQNRAVDDLTGPNPCPGVGWGYCQRASGEIESEGVEFEISGALTPNWQIAAGFTHLIAEYTKDTDKNLIGTQYSPELPRNQFKLSTMYKLPGDLSRWRIGGNVYAQNSVKGSWGGQAEQKDYALFGLQVGYRPTDQLDLRLAVNNLFDKYYYSNVGWSTGGNVFGAPRNATLTAEYRF